MIDFAYLYDKHIDNLFAFGSRFTTDREMVKDCIHDVFVKLFAKGPQCCRKSGELSLHLAPQPHQR